MLGEKELNDIIYAMEFGNLDLFYKLSPNVQKRLLALNSDLAQKISGMDEYRKSNFKGHTAEEVQKNINSCCDFYKFEQNLYRRKDKIYNDSEVLDGAWKYFYEDDAKGVINKILSIDPKEIDKLFELGLETSQGASWGVKGKEIKVKDALAMIVEMFPSLFFKLPIEIQDKILDHKYEKGVRSVRESVRSYVKMNLSLYNFLPVVTENFLTEDEKEWKKQIEECYKTKTPEKKENPVEETKSSHSQDSKSEDDTKEEIPIGKPEGKEIQEPVEKPDEKDEKQEIIDESETESEIEYEDDIKKEIANENLKDKEKQNAIEKTNENRITLSQEEASNKIENMISRVDKFLGSEKEVFSLEEVKSALKTAVELAYACGRLDGCKINKSKWLEDVKYSDKITICNFIAVFIAVLFDSKKSIFRKSDWNRKAFKKNMTSVIKELKGAESVKSGKKFVPAQSTNVMSHKHNKFIGF